MKARVDELLANNYQQNPEKEILHFLNDTYRQYTSFTYQAILEKTSSLLHRFQSVGLKKGDHLAVIMENTVESIHASLACLLSGVILDIGDPFIDRDVLHPMAPEMRVEKQMQIIEMCAPKALYLDAKKYPQLIERAKATYPELHVIDSQSISSTDVNWGLISALSKDISENDTALICTTSGTTAKFTGVEITYSQIINQAHNCRNTPLIQVERTMTILPLAHMYGFIITLIHVLLNKEVLFISPTKLQEATLRYDAQSFYAVPIFYQMVAKKLKQAMDGAKPSLLKKALMGAVAQTQKWNRNLSYTLARKLIYPRIPIFGRQMKYLASSGAFLDSETSKFFFDIGQPIRNGWGLVQTCGPFTLNASNTDHDRSVGSPIHPDLKIKIHAPNVRGEGEVLVQGPTVFRGYFRNPEKTAQDFDDGWFRTGDVGRIVNGRLSLVGRAKQLIIRGGENVAPEEIIDIYKRYVPEIEEMTVVSKKITDNELAYAYIHPKLSQMQNLSTAELLDLFKTKIASVPASSRYRIDEYQIIFEPFPKTALNKIKNYELIEKYGMAAQSDKASAQRAKKEDPFLQGEIGASVVKLLKSLAVNETVSITSDSLLSLDLGIGSLTLVEFWATLERTFGVSIPEEKMAELKTVGQVIRFIHENRQTSQTANAMGNRPATAESWTEILEAKPDGNEKIADEILNSYPHLRPIFLKTFRGFFRTLSHLRINGLENIPNEGPFIIAPNHECYLDNIFVACLLPEVVQKNMACIGAREFLDKPLTRLLAHLCHMIPVDRQNVSSAALQLGVSVLRQGKILLVHPEGTRSPHGKLLPLKPGVALLALHVNCPIVPIYIEGAHEFWPKDAKFPKSRGNISITIGKPLLPQKNISGESSLYMKEAQSLTSQLNKRFLSLGATEASAS